MKLSMPLLFLLSGVFCHSCSNPNASTSEHLDSIEISSLTDSVLQVDTPDMYLAEATSLGRFLIDPFDLLRFKQTKRNANSSILNRKPFYYKPSVEGNYWSYNAFSAKAEGYYGEISDSSVIRSVQGLELIVFKKNGQYQHIYDDPTEELIEVRATYNDYDLPELAFVGLSKSTVEARLGTPDYIHQDCLVYQYGNNVLILHCYIPYIDGLIDWLKYVRLEEGIDSKEVKELFEW